MYRLSMLLCICVVAPAGALAATCTPTGFFGLTAALINPPGTVSGTVDGTGCNIVIYYSAGAGGTVKNANLFGADSFGVAVNGDAGAVNVDIISSSIHDIGDTPHNGDQQGVAVYYRGYFDVSAVTGKITGNQIRGYQKGGIVANGQGTHVNVMDNVVTGDGHVTFTAMNGIQIGFGASASVMRNTVSGNSYIGFPGDGSASGGVLVVGGPGYGTCPDGNDCRYTNGVMVNGNTLINNDVGVYFSNLQADFSAPLTATNDKAVNNTISDDQCFNASYQAAISDVGNNDKMITNTISGPGYIGCFTVFNPTGNAIDASTTFTNRPKVHANK